MEGLADLPNLPDGEGNESADSADVEGVIVDGYVEGARVFLDLNGNQLHDDDEPSATSDEKGAFKLHVENFDREQFAAAFLQAEIPDTAKDSDDMGRTLREAGKKSFTLLSPASALLDQVDNQPTTSGKPEAERAPVKGAVLSPLSTLVVGEMIERGVPLAEAKAAVQVALGLPGKELLRDFVANPDAVLHNVARAAAVSLGEAAGPRTGDSDAGVMQRPGMQIVEAVRSVKEQLPQVIDALDLRKDSAMPASVDRVKAEFAEQMKRADEARAALAADAGVPAIDPMTGKPMAGSGAPAATTGTRMAEPMPWLPPAATNPSVGSDAGVRMPEPTKPLPGAADAGMRAPLEPIGPVQPPSAQLPKPEGSGSGSAVGAADAGVRSPELKPAGPDVRPDAGMAPSGSAAPPYAPYDAGVGYRK